MTLYLTFLSPLKFNHETAMETETSCTSIVKRHYYLKIQSPNPSSLCFAATHTYMGKAFLYAMSSEQAMAAQ